EGKTEIYAPLDEYVPEIENDLELNEQERAAYEQFKLDHNPEALRNLEPISVAKIYLQANADGDQETSYALYTTREDRVMWSKEEDKKYWEQDPMFAKTDNKAFYGLGSGTFHQQSEYEGYISFRNKDGDMGFQMVKEENGIWKVSFMPIQ
ncbi:RNA polymerase subunit sigma, partial [Bacillus sp. JJ1521]|uniref:RNA polymerase subunit sigma n=1 Tax=Bacillus sp. JJ1521 TaxID=3122957 RepID=UPI00300049E3